MNINSTLLNEAIAIKVRDVVRAGLTAGMGNPLPGQMCVEAPLWRPAVTSDELRKRYPLCRNG